MAYYYYICYYVILSFIILSFIILSFVILSFVILSFIILSFVILYCCFFTQLYSYTGGASMRKRSASMAAWQPVAAAVMAWR